MNLKKLLELNSETCPLGVGMGNCDDVKDMYDIIELAIEAYTLRDQLKIATDALEWLNSGLCGMFGMPGKSDRDEFYELAPQRVHEALAKIQEMGK